MIVIEDMDLPKGCQDCRLRVNGYCAPMRHWCFRGLGDNAPKERPPNCPISEPASTHKSKIMHRLSEHLNAVKDKHKEWVGIFLQGSQNYNLDYNGSDIDSKLIVLPSFEDFVLNNKPYSYTHIMENNEHVDVKDIRLMFECFRKQNINFVEILFTPYRIMNPKYEDLFQPVFDAKERIGRYNDFAALNCMAGMALEKQKALCHPYPATIDKIEKFGYDPKQLHHILRIEEFMDRWLHGDSYAACLISKKSDWLRYIKINGIGSKDEAVRIADEVVNRVKSVKDKYMETRQAIVDRGVDEILNTALVELFKHNFKTEIGGEKVA